MVYAPSRGKLLEERVRSCRSTLGLTIKIVCASLLLVNIEAGRNVGPPGHDGHVFTLSAKSGREGLSHYPLSLTGGVGKIIVEFLRFFGSSGGQDGEVSRERYLCGILWAQDGRNGDKTVQRPMALGRCACVIPPRYGGKVSSFVLSSLRRNPSRRSESCREVAEMKVSGWEGSW